MQNMNMDLYLIKQQVKPGELTDEEFLEDIEEISRLMDQASEIFKKKKKLNANDQD